MDTQAINLKIQTAEAAASLKDVKTSLKDIKDAMLAVGEDSPEFDKLAAAAAKLKDRVEEANEKINNMNPDQFAGLQRIAQGAATGIQLMTSSMALFGAESEEVQKTMMKVQAAMALADAVNNIENMKKGFQDLFEIMIANPILAVVAAITALIVAGNEWLDSQVKNTNEVKRATAAAEEQKKVTEKLTEQYDNQIKILEAQGASEKDIVDVKKLKIDAQIAELKADNEVHLATIQAIKDNDDLEESYWRVIEASLRKIGADEKADAIAKFIQQQKYLRMKDDLDAYNENLKTIEQLTTDRQVLDITLTKHTIDNANERIAASQKENEAFLKQMAELNKGLKEAQDEQIAHQKQLDDEADASTMRMLEQYDAEADAAEAAERRKREAARLSSEQLKFYRKTDREFAVTQAASMFESLSALTKKHAKLSKGFAIAQTLIETYAAAQKAYASQLSIPTPDAPIRANIAAAVAVLSGLARVAAIKGVDENGGGGGGGNPSVADSSSSMNTQPAGIQPSTLLDENGNVVNNQQPQQQNNRVFVVESDITHTQQQVNVVQTAMRF